MKTNSNPVPGTVSVTDDPFETVRSETAHIASERTHDPESEAGHVSLAAPAAKAITPQRLKARAVALLARREHSRIELMRKLSGPDTDPVVVERILDDLVKEGWLSDTRFAAAVVHRRSAQKGTAAIVHELKNHGLSAQDITDIRHQLAETEYERAVQVYQRKFSVPVADTKDYARRVRFMASRGFASDLIRRIIGPMPCAPRQ